MFPRYYRHLTVLLEGANKQLPENAVRLGVKHRAQALVTGKGMGLGLRNSGPLAKTVILGTCLAPLNLSSLICKVGTITPTFPRGSWRKSNEIMWAVRPFANCPPLHKQRCYYQWATFALGYEQPEGKSNAHLGIPGYSTCTQRWKKAGHETS